MLKRYSDFLHKNNNTSTLSPLLENVDQAQKFMLQKYVLDNPEKKEEKEKFDAEFKKKMLESPEFKAKNSKPMKNTKKYAKLFPQWVLEDYTYLEKILEPNKGWTNVFIKFYFDDLYTTLEKGETPVIEDRNLKKADIETLYNRIRTSGNLLQRLPKQIVEYDGRIEDGVEWNMEKLNDDLEDLTVGAEAKKLVNHLKGDLRREYQRSDKQTKDKISLIAKEFYKLSVESQETFIAAVSRHDSLADFIKGIDGYIKGVNNASTSKIVALIDDLNKKLGKSFGAEVVFMNDNLIVFEVRSYNANTVLNSGTTHCIARPNGEGQSYWDSYVGGPDKYTKQYYIHNFNLPMSDPMSVIGTTIGQQGQIEYAQTKDNRPMDLKKYCNKWSIPMDVFKTMTKEEAKAKAARAAAVKAIRQVGISIFDKEEIKRLVALDANINTNNGEPLKNAVVADDLELTKFLLDECGADASYSQAISYVKSFEILALLIKYGAKPTVKSLQTCIDDAKAMKYLIDNGLDPDMKSGDTKSGAGAPLRKAIAVGSIDVIKVLLDAGASIDLRSGTGSIGLAIRKDQIEVVQQLLDKGAKLPPSIDREVKFYETILNLNNVVGAKEGAGRIMDEPLAYKIVKNKITITADVRKDGLDLMKIAVGDKIKIVSSANNKEWFTVTAVDKPKMNSRMQGTVTWTLDGDPVEESPTKKGIFQVETPSRLRMLKNILERYKRKEAGE